MPSTKLKPLPACPFCNGKPKRIASKFTPDDATPKQKPDGTYEYKTKTWYGVKCESCGIAQPRRTYLTREESDNAWSKRA